MKKLLFVVVLLIGAQAYAQVDFGLYGGTNFANVNVKTPDLSTDSRTGYQAGTYIRVGDFLYGQVGLEYQMLKTNFSGFDDVDIMQKDDVKFHIINVPAYVGLSLVPVVDGIVDIRVYAGPNLACLLDVPVNEMQFTRDDFKTVKLNGVVGAGVDILFLSVDMGYNFDATNFFNNGNEGKAHYAFINAGIKF